jgi:hypothetical protein
MSTVTASAPAVAAGSTTRTIITAAGLAGAVACAAVIASWFLFANLTRADATLEPLSVVGGLIAGAAFAVLAATLPSLSATGRLPRTPLVLAALACAFLAIPAWTSGTVLPHLAAHTTAAQYEQLGHADFRLLLLDLPMIVLGIVGFISLAVAGWRRRAIPRGASVLLILAGLATLMGDFPPAGVLAGLALAWTARSLPPTDQ